MTDESACVVCSGALRPGPRTLPVSPPLVGGMVRTCTNCGSAQVDPRPSPAQLARLYSADYYAEYAERSGMAGGIEEAAPHLRSRLDELTARFGKGHLLDLGSAQGVFVAYARDQGWDAMGIETSAWAAAEGRRRYGVRIYETPIEEAPIAPASLDVVHSNHVLEHLIDPLAAMRAAHRLLKPGGIFVAEVPQELFRPLAESFQRRLYRGIGSEPNYHVVFFSRRGLQLAAERAGFVVERIDNVRHLEALRPRGWLVSFVRGIVYGLERVLRRGPAYVLVARRPER